MKKVKSKLLQEYLNNIESPKSEREYLKLILEALTEQYKK